MFTYCGNNPVSRIDPSGAFWKELWENIKERFSKSSATFIVAAGISQADSPAPGPADVFALGIATTVALVCVGGAVIDTIRSTSVSTSKSKVKEKDITTTPPPKSTVIYRYGGTNPGNLTPKAKDLRDGRGLSFSTVPAPGCSMTTIEALNATGIVYAVRDGATHVSVYPVGGTMSDWVNAGSSSIWTQAVKSVTIKWDSVS